MVLEPLDFMSALPPPPLQLIVSIIVSSVGGAAFLIAWAVLRQPMASIYLKRTVSERGEHGLSPSAL